MHFTKNMEIISDGGTLGWGFVWQMFLPSTKFFNPLAFFARICYNTFNI